METSFEFVGDNKQLLQTIQEIQSNLEGLQKVANKYGVSTEEVMKALTDRMNEVGTNGAQTVVSGMKEVEKGMEKVSTSAKEVEKDFSLIFGSGSVITMGTISEKLKDFDLSTYKEQLKQYGAAGEDAGGQINSLNQALTLVNTELGNVSVSNKKQVATLQEYEEKLKQMKDAVRAYNAEQFQSSGVKFEVGAGDPTVLVGNNDNGNGDDKIEEKRKTIGDLIKEVDDGKAHVEELYQALSSTDKSDEGLKKLMESEKQWNDEMTKTDKTILTLNNTYESLTQKSADAANSGNTELANSLHQQAQRMAEAKKAAEEYQDSLIDMKHAVDSQKGGNENEENATTEIAPVSQDTEEHIGRVKQAVDQLKGSFADLGGSLGQSVRGIKMLGKGGAESVKGLSMLTQGVKGVGAALKAAFITNPIGLAIAAIVAVIALLVKSVQKFFTGTEEGSKVFMKLKGVIDGVKAVLDNFMENLGRNIVGIGKAFANLGKIFKGEAKIGDFFSWEGDSKGIYEAAKTESLALQELHEKRRKWMKEEKELEAENAKLREVMYSGGKLEQMAAIAKMQDNINAKYAKEIELAKEEANIKKENLLANGVTFDSKGDVKSTGNASTAQIDEYVKLQTNVVNLQKQQNTELSTMGRRYGAIIRAAGEYEKQQRKLLSDLQYELSKEVNKGAKDAEVDNLRLRLQYATDINEQLDLENKIRERELAAEKEQLQLEEKRRKEQVNNRTKQDILTWYGQEAADEFQAALDNGTTLTKFSKQYANIKTGKMEDDPMGILASNALQNEQISATFDMKEQNAEDKAEREKHRLELEKDINAYKDYVNEIVEAEKWRQEQLDKLGTAEGNGLTREQIDKGYNDKVSMAARDKGIDGTEADIARIVSKLQADISDVTFDEVSTKLQEFLNSVDEQIAMYKDEKGMSYSDYQNDINANQAIVGSENSTEQQRADALAQIKADEEAISALKAESAAGDGVLLKLIEARKRGEDMAAQAQEKAGKKSKKDLQMQQKQFALTNESIDLVIDTTKQLANTFGNVLGDKAKKALSTVAETGDVAKTVVKGVETVVKAVDEGILGTTTTAVTGIQAVEKASVILAIISMAIQVVMKIIEIAKKFSKDQKLQDAIDESKEKVEDLKRSNEKLQKTFKNKAGVDYYKGMYEAAKDLDRVIAQQSKSISLAQERYENALDKYGENNDKTKDAKKELQDLQDDQDETIEKQQEQMEQLRNDLLTTDLKSFSQSLAESMVEGFAQGKDSIEDTFDEMLDDLMRSMMTKNLAIAFEGQFEKVFGEMNKRIDDNGGSLSVGDIDYIMDMMEGAKDRATTLAETYYDIMDSMGILTDEDEEASKGSITGLTQDQGDQLNARFTALQIEGANVVAATQAMQIALTQIGTDVTLQTSIMQSIQAQCTLGTQIAQNQLDELRVISAHTAAIEEHAARLKAIEQNTARL